jgi:hypothetical protein
MAAAIVAIVLAFLGYLATYVNGLRLAQRHERLSRVNRQLTEFYGPLLALTQSNRRIFEEFVTRHHRAGGVSPFVAEDGPTEAELVEWRLWFTTVFMPNIRRMRGIVVDRADLLMESSMPVVLLALCAHVSGYEITISRWESRDYSEHTSVVAYPGQELDDYVSGAFAVLKRQQTRLLGRRKAGSRP